MRLLPTFIMSASFLRNNVSQAHCQDKALYAQWQAQVSDLVRVHMEQKHIPTFKVAPCTDALPRVQMAFLCSFSSSFSAV